jgi:orotate phosphoribosyltransferase
LNNPSEIARALLRIDAVGFSPEKPLTFKSGILSPIYVDNRRLPFNPPEWRTVIEGFRALIDTEHPDFDVIAGVAVGGIPHSAALAYTLGKPSVFIRKEAKEHGTQKRVEGGDVRDLKVLLVEDLITTGGTSLSAVDVLRAEGALVDLVIAIVGYGFAEATGAFSHAGVRLVTLTSFEVILAEALNMGKFDAAAQAVIEDWLRDPIGWGERHGHI